MGVTNYHTVNGRIIGEDGPNGAIDYQIDALGSVVGTMDSSGSVQKVYRYKPSGAVLNDSGPGPEPAFRWVGSKGYRFTGNAQADSYVRARHYSSYSGAWTSVDRLWPSQPAFTYAKSSPTVHIDPSGLAAPPCCCSAEKLWLSPPKYAPPPIQIPADPSCGSPAFTLLAGVYFTLNVDVDIAKVPFGQHIGGPCSLEWWENSNISDRTTECCNVQPGQWVNVFSCVTNCNVCQKDQWAQVKWPCANVGVPVGITDWPGYSQSVPTDLIWLLQFKWVLLSGGGYCGNGTVTLNATYTLQIVNGTVVKNELNSA